MTEPYQRKEVIGDCTLYLGDCREILPTLGKVDAVVTDPPYGIDGGKGGDAKEYGKGNYSGAFQDTEEYIINVCVPIIEMAIRNSLRAAVTPGRRSLMLYPKPADIGCFYTPASVTHGPWGFNSFSPILYYGKDFRAGYGSLPTGITLTAAAEKTGHPCTKPLEAWKWLLHKASQPNESILDPFMGSGTTGVACVQLGRKFLGIEIETKYFDIACRRIQDEVRRPRLPLPEPVKAEQTDMGL